MDWLIRCLITVMVVTTLTGCAGSGSFTDTLATHVSGVTGFTSGFGAWSRQWAPTAKSAWLARDIGGW